MASIKVLSEENFEPKGFKEAESTPYALEWAASRDEEIQSIFDAGVLQPAVVPLGRKALRLHFVYKVKLDSNPRAK
jgi:hypothetical protein